ncbi:uncharacterized protein LOC117175540 [Belonocnema kinseyi]|uniref:uncharacterized protein LOC117175540 n=1 Tax=Belonocnema kinseyi TaxID=2817044 RepID=UPI00143D08E7|nr:uncharacterized protein LOC117175540 [Belonocnema kinseyi]
MYFSSRKSTSFIHNQASGSFNQLLVFPIIHCNYSRKTVKTRPNISIGLREREIEKGSIKIMNISSKLVLFYNFYVTVIRITRTGDLWQYLKFILEFHYQISIQ